MPGTFIIEELNPLGGKLPKGGLARFEWTAAKRNIPLQPWSFGVHQRTIRTDYPGADDPTEQVLGPQFEPFTLRGRWDDRYNTNSDALSLLATPGGGRATTSDIREFVGGYAMREQVKFEEMVRRGNPVKLTFEKLTIQGVITDANFDYRRDWDIGYDFTLSPHHRQPGGFFALKRSPRQVLNAKQLRQEVQDEIDIALELHARAPQIRLIGTKYPDAQEGIDAWENGILAIDRAIEQRGLTIEIDPNGALLRLAAAFLELSTIGSVFLTLLKDDDSSEALDFDSGAIAVLDYDVWARGIQSQARRIIVAAQRSASELQQRAEPNAIALYRPQENEHLYAVSNRFYRTPHNWRLIFERNGLESTTLLGDELLIIPEVTER